LWAERSPYHERGNGEKVASLPGVVPSQGAGRRAGPIGTRSGFDRDASMPALDGRFRASTVNLWLDASGARRQPLR
jgi:hypothetical protein